jgi:hypothetical protein
MASLGRGKVLAGAILAFAACSDRTDGERGPNQRAQGAAGGAGGQLAGQPAAPSPAEVGRASHEVAGTLTQAATDHVVIRTDSQGDVALRLDDGTRITVDGQPAAPDRLQEGTEVRAAFDASKGAGRPTATFIQAESAAAASARTTNQAHGNAGASPAGSGLGPGPSPEGGGHDQNASGKKNE